jgi:membrane protein involved in colicin uptake
MVSIDELDDDANKLVVLWKKTLNFAASYDETYQQIQNKIKSGQYGPEWYMERWLVVKCGLTERSSLRMIREFHKMMAEDRREEIERRLEEVRRQKIQEKENLRKEQERNKRQVEDKIGEAAQRRLRTAQILREAEEEKARTQAIKAETKRKQTRARSTQAKRNARDRLKTAVRNSGSKNNIPVPPDLKIVT